MTCWRIRKCAFIIPLQQRWRGNSDAVVHVWLGEWVRPSVRLASPCGHDTDYSFCTITFKLHMYCLWWEEEPYWLGVAGSKVKVNFDTLPMKPCGQDIEYSFCLITFKLYMSVVDDERRNFWVAWSKVKVNFDILCVKTCGHNTDNIFSPITFKLHPCGDPGV